MKKIILFMVSQKFNIFSNGGLISEEKRVNRDRISKPIRRHI